MTAPARVWKLALAPLLIWTAHFFIAYGLMLIFPLSDFVRWLTVALGFLGLAALFMVHRAAGAARERRVLPAILVSGVAIFWQSLVAFF